MNKSKALVLIAGLLLVLGVSSVLAMSPDETTRAVAHNEIKGDETKHTNTFFGNDGGLGGAGGMPSTGGGTDGGDEAGGGMPSVGGAGGETDGGNGAGSYSGGFSDGGAYGGGTICKLGCCSKSYGYSHGGGGYYGCTCCPTLAAAKAYKENNNQARAETKN